MRIAKWVISVLFLVSVLGLVAEASPATRVRVKVQRANVRESPDIKSSIIMTVKIGTIFEVADKIGAWYVVILAKTGTVTRDTAYIHESVVEEMAPAAQPEQVTPPPAEIEKPVQKETVPPEKKVAPQPIPPPAPPKEPYKKIFLRLQYQRGFQEQSHSLSFSRTVYYENAPYGLAYTAKKGSSIDAAVGFRFARMIGVALGFSSTSRDMNEKTSVSIPHPLWVNTPRTGEVEMSALKISAIDLYFNLVLFLDIWKFGFDIYGGPCYMLTKADIITDISFSEGSYPYSQASVTASTATVKSNVIGFNAGASLGLRLMRNLAIFADGRYITGKGTYKPGNDIPDLSLSLGGLKAGAGIKIMF
jgi:hypothetical protein